MKNRVYYEKLDTLRLMSCIVVFLYHLNILKGGFLVVCIFFTLSGFLSCFSSLSREKFSIKEYYINRVKKIYLPLIIVVFITLAVLSFFKDINWLNLKPETTSVLFGYNNFWQLDAKLDYFRKQIDSPFMHMWYISILLQLELIFPIMFIILKWFKDKVNKYIPTLITLILSIFSYLYFFENLTSNNLMVAYYGTLSRLFSYLIGVSFAFLVIDRKAMFKKKYKVILNNIVFYGYMLLLIVIFLFVNVKSNYLELYMLFVTLIGVRLISYGMKISNSNNNFLDKVISGLSKISYEIYLVQYPVIFIFQNIRVGYAFIKIPCIVLLTIILSFILHVTLNKFKKYKIPLILLVFASSVYGLYQYVITEDHTKEMQELEEKIEKNKLLAEQKQKEYQERLKQEQDNWQLELEKFSDKEEELKKKITNLSVVGVGDSVMLGAANALYKTFPNGYFDGKVNRTTWQARDILLDLINKGILGDVIIFNLGTNGDCSNTCWKQLMQTVGNRQVFWVNATNPDYDTFNPSLEKKALEYSNIHIVDWVSVAEGHPEYLASDRVHVGGVGARVYSQTIYDTIYKFYLNELDRIKEEKIKEHNEQEKKRVTFFGNGLLLNVYEYIQDDYQTSEFIINNKLTYSILKEDIEKRINENIITDNLVFLFDGTLKLNKVELQDIADLCVNRNVVIITTSDIIVNEKENFNVISLSEKLKVNKKYLSPDRIHLTEEGNLLLRDIIKEVVKER